MPADKNVLPKVVLSVETLPNPEIPFFRDEVPPLLESSPEFSHGEFLFRS